MNGITQRNLWLFELLKPLDGGVFDAFWTLWCKQSVKCICIYLCYLLLLRSGPSANSSSVSSDDISTTSYSHILNSGLSVMYLNIQSLKPKLDILEVESHSYDVLVFTETWLSVNDSNDYILIPGFNPPFRCDRTYRQGGGVAIYVRHDIHVVERPDLSSTGLECVWVEIAANSRKILVGGIYRPPNANNSVLLAVTGTEHRRRIQSKML